VDTSHSGAIVLGENGILTTEPIKGLQENTHVVIASCQLDENSHESSTLRGGYFTQLLIRALRQSQGKSSMLELYSSVRATLSDLVSRDLHVRQTPILSMSGPEGRIVMGETPK
jgi:hypothetical protein